MVGQTDSIHAKMLRNAGPLLGLALLAYFLLVPPWEPLTAAGMRAIGVFLFTIIWWSTVGITYPSLLCLVLLVLTGVMSPAAAYGAAAGNWIVFFLLGSFGLCEAMRVTGFTTRFALWFLTRPIAEGRPWVLLSLFLLACTLMGAVMSVTATAIVFITIAGSMLEALGFRRGDRFAASLMMGVAWTATAAHAMTPIAHVTNLMMIQWLDRDFGYTISFPQWMSIGIPAGLVAWLLIMAFLRYVVRPDLTRFSQMPAGFLERQQQELGAMEPAERVAVGTFLAVVLVWVFPDLAGGLSPGLSSYVASIGYAVPALAGACLLCLVHVRGQPVLTFQQWMGKGVDWGSMVLVMAILALGDVIAQPELGITGLLTRVFEPVISGMAPYSFLFVTVLWTAAQTNVLSNLVSMTTVYTIMGPLAGAAGIANPVAMGMTIAAASCYAFALPSATTATALVIGSGWVPVKFMLRYGLLLILPVVVLFTFFFYPLAAAVLR